MRGDLSELVHRYAALADSRNMSELVGLFLPDALLVVPEPPDRLDAFRALQGREQIAGQLRLLRGVAVTVHAIVGEVYDVEADGSAARGRVACVAHHVSDGRDVAWHLHYDDLYSPGPDGWRFARRALEIDFIATSSVSRWRGPLEDEERTG